MISNIAPGINRIMPTSTPKISKQLLAIKATYPIKPMTDINRGISFDVYL
jgi:hypothetical protein